MRGSLDIRPIAGRIGAQIAGIRLSGDLDPEIVTDIRDALNRYKVIFFRDQGHLDDIEQERFARCFGPILVHPVVDALPGPAQVYELDSRSGQRANSWHADSTFLREIPMGSVLRAVKVPACGGDTMWANMASAYLDLPDELRALADTLWGVHTNVGAYGGQHAFKKAEIARANPYPKLTSIVFETAHPIVHVHPETDEKMILTGGHWARGLLGYAAPVARPILDLLQAAATRPENTMRWRWRDGDVVLWDNRATQHYALDDYDGATRIMHRVGLAGEPMRSVCGDYSYAMSETPRIAAAA